MHNCGQSRPACHICGCKDELTSCNGGANSNGLRVKHLACPESKKGTGGAERITKTVMLSLIASVHKSFFLSNSNNFGSLLKKNKKMYKLKFA